MRVGLTQNSFKRYLNVCCAASPILEQNGLRSLPLGASLLEMAGPEAMDERSLPHGSLSVPVAAGGVLSWVDFLQQLERRGGAASTTEKMSFPPALLRKIPGDNSTWLRCSQRTYAGQVDLWPLEAAVSLGEWPRALPPFAPLRGGAISFGKLPLEVCWILLESGLERVCLFPSHHWGGGDPQPLTLESGPPEAPSSAAAGTLCLFPGPCA